MSTIKVVTPPSEPPVSLEVAKAHLNVDFDDDDVLIEAFIEAATDYAEQFLGRSLVEQTLDYYLDAFPTAEISLPRPPLIEVEGLFYRDSNGDEQEFTAFSVDTTSEPGRVYLSASGSWPTPADTLNAVRVRYRAGYLDSNSPPIESVPHAIKAAILLTIGTLYAQRETIVVGQAVNTVPWSAEHLLRRYRFDLSLA